MHREIFLSYAREDVHMANRLAEALNEEGFAVWSDQYLAGGAVWIDELDRRLKNAAAVVVIWSADSVESEWVLAEASIGLDRDVLVPILVESCYLPDPFGEIQLIDLSGWEGGLGYGPFQDLVTAIEIKFGLEDALDDYEFISHDLELIFDDLDPETLWNEAHSGDPEAQYLLGLAFENGLIGFARNPHEALGWLKGAARQGYLDAYATVGDLYYLEKGDVLEAMKWYKRAVKVGDGHAAWQMAEIYAAGVGEIRKNLKLAYRYYIQAAELGDETAIALLNELDE